jgi:hypothetical protein
LSAITLTPGEGWTGRLIARHFGWLVAAAVLAIGLLLGYAIASPALARIVLGVAVSGLLVAWVFIDRDKAIPAVVVYLVLLGALRRWLSFELGSLSNADPLLAVGPLVTAALFLVAARRGAFRERNKLTSVVLLITVLGVVGAVNPLQGSLAAALPGMVIFLVPILWFWIGRTLVDDRKLAQVYAIVGGLAVLAAVYGIAQSVGFFFSFDQFWVDAVQDTYVSIKVGRGVVRGFGFASSAAEYGKLLGLAVAIYGARFLTRRNGSRLVYPALGLVLGVALLLSALRTTTVLTVVACGALYGAQKGASITRVLCLGVAGVIVLVLGLSLLGPRFGEDNVGVLVERQVSGLSDPLNPGESTLGQHGNLVVRAVQGAITTPTGQGTATITIAGKKFGESQAGDMDAADAAIAFGVVGIYAYVMLCWRLGLRAYTVAVRRRDWLALAALGVGIVSSLQWLNGGLYTIGPLAWMTFGWLDRRANADVAAGDLEPQAAVAAT